MMQSPPITLMSEDEVASYGVHRRTDASFGALETARGLLPLVALSVDARVSGVVASIEVVQTFVNTTGGAIEATYIFPLPDRAAVHRFRMEVAGRVIEGVVDERGAAREQYDQAIAAGHRAAISEEDRAGVFSLRVGNLMAGESATIRLSLVGPLPIDDGELTLQFPLVVAPRYIPGTTLGGDQAGLGVAADTDLVPDASRISPPVRLPGLANPVALAIRVAIADVGTVDLVSSLHAVTISERDALIVDVRPGERLDRDFILRWRVEPVRGSDSAVMRPSLICADDADCSGGTFMLTLVPPSTSSVEAKPRDIVFVLDRSGSMQGWKMVAARRAVARMIDSLTSRDRFCAIAFSSELELVPGERLEPATDRARFRAVEALAAIDAEGGTEMLEPLRKAVALLDRTAPPFGGAAGPGQAGTGDGGTDDRSRVVVLVTDGQVGNEDEMLRVIAPSLRSVRMFSLGIDQAVNAAFLRRLAGAGGGMCELVESEDRLDVVMAKVHRRIGTPVVTELALRASNLAIEMDSIAPTKLSDLYAGAPLTICGRYRGVAPTDASLEVVGSKLDGPLLQRVERTTNPGDTSWVAASWARAKIRDLEDRYAATPGDALAASIVALSKRYSVLSRFTAFLAVDRSEVVNAGGRVRTIVQAVDAPAGWGAPEEQERSRGGSVRATSVGAAQAPKSRMAPPSMTMPAPMAPARPMSLPAQAPRGLREMAAAPRSPAAPPPPAPSRPFVAKKGSGSGSGSGSATVDPTIDAAPYLAQLAEHARALTVAADLQHRYRIRQRLVEWLEDVRSVGLTALAATVERIVDRLASALGTNNTATIATIATELGAIAVTAPPSPTKPNRLAFWK